ncbi:MAG: DNA ligase D [Bacteroidetes bacterium]|nr:DNA ligase D [Bacteroidota bacterium]
MLATLGSEAFDSPDWIYEPKYDGYRTLALCDGQGGVQLYSRNLLSFDEVYAPVREQLESIKYPCLLDGEVVVENSKGRSDFQLLQQYNKTRQGNLKYYVFDLLSLDGKDLTRLTLLQRKELLEKLLSKQKFKDIIYSKHIEEHGIRYLKEAARRGWEGIMAKRADSIYQIDKRSKDWIKLKITQEEEAVIGGFTMPQGARIHFGSLLLGAYTTEGELIYTGNCGTGFNDETLRELFDKFQPLLTDRSPFANEVKRPGGRIQWLKPKLVCQVKFTEWTDENSMRHPVYMGLRIDKKPKEVIREKPADMKKVTAKATKKMPVKAAVKKAVKAPAKKAAKAGTKTTVKARPSDKSKDAEPGPATGKESKATEVKVGRAVLKLTNAQKLYWPDEGITKGEMVQYYSDIAPFILPYLKDRPQSLHRFPNGIHGPSFYQKDQDTAQIPSWLRSEKVYSESNKEEIDYLICNDRETLMYMANLGCIEIHPWNSRIGHLDNPDWLVIDLDPDDNKFTEVVEVAKATKKVFDQLGMDCYAKTSGATGIHIFAPLDARYEYDVARNFAQLVARQVHTLVPDTTSLERQPKNRKGKIYIDYLQNSKGQTLAAPYSLRPRPGATVSTPLDWSEVNNKLDPRTFTMKNILKRLDKKGDLWQGVLSKGNDLKKALKILEGLQ